MTKKKSSSKKAFSVELPTKDQILEFIQTSSDKVGKREIARAFHIRGDQRKDLKILLNEMSAEGLISGNRKQFKQPGKLSSVAVLEVTGVDDFGDYFALPTNWDTEEHGAPPKVLLKNKPGKRKSSSSDIPGIGERILARISHLKSSDENSYAYSAHVLKVVTKDKKTHLGIYRVIEDQGGMIDPIDKKYLRQWPVPKGEENNATDGELVKFEPVKAGRFGVAKAKVIECLGNPDDQRAISLIAIHNHGIRNDFNADVLKEADELKICEAGSREDLRNIPLITIDPEDAKDHDDAVWAKADEDSANPGGWVVIVAIADVAYYVRTETIIDIEARKRGNSTYFPDRVVPMLPERISNNLCSLRYDEDRPCLAVEMTFDKDGHKIKHRFIRGFMRSAAKLSYLQAQNAIDGQPDDTCSPVLETILKPLWSAYSVVKKARENRQPLDLDIPEKKVLLNDKGYVSEVVTPARLDAHKLIEEFMIQANVSAAEELEKQKIPLIYRVHDAPSEEKIASLSDFLSTLNVKFPKGTNLKPQLFNKILEQSKNTEFAHIVSEVVLRSQSQAEYNEENAGHFGLNLRRYAHFTSPIRRYSDLIVHRALIRSLGLGEDGLQDEEIEELSKICEEISDLERKSMAAERETIDRLISAYLSEHIGANFQGRISGVTKSGLFVRLVDSGAEGFIPISTLADDYYNYDDKSRTLVGEKYRLGFSLGDIISVRLVEVVPSAGAIRFEVINPGKKVQFKTNNRKKTVKRSTTYKRSRRKG